MICVGTNQGEKCEGGKENNHTDENLLRRKGFEVLLETKVDIKHWKVIEKEYQIGFTYPEAKGYKFPSAFFITCFFPKVVARSTSDLASASRACFM